MTLCPGCGISRNFKSSSLNVAGEFCTRGIEDLEQDQESGLAVAEPTQTSGHVHINQQSDSDYQSSRAPAETNTVDSEASVVTIAAPAGSHVTAQQSEKVLGGLEHLKDDLNENETSSIDSEHEPASSLEQDTISLYCCHCLTRYDCKSKFGAAFCGFPFFKAACLLCKQRNHEWLWIECTTQNNPQKWLRVDPENGNLIENNGVESTLSHPSKQSIYQISMILKFKLA